MDEIQYRAMSALAVAKILPPTLEGALETLDDARRLIERLYRDLEAEDAREDRSEAA